MNDHITETNDYLVFVLAFIKQISKVQNHNLNTFYI